MSKVTEWLDAPEFQNAFFTSVFRCQLDALTLQRVINPFAVLDEIRGLEGNQRRRSRTKAPSRFKGGLLHGFMHKHFFNARHLAKNLQNYWSQGDYKALSAVRKVVSEGTSGDLWELSGATAHRYVHVAFEHKSLARSLTGDWIIYKRQNHHNYYLCLAGHEESDENIHDRIASCTEVEFPELGIRVRHAQQAVQSDGPASGGPAG